MEISEIRTISFSYISFCVSSNYKIKARNQRNKYENKNFLTKNVRVDKVYYSNLWHHNEGFERDGYFPTSQFDSWLNVLHKLYRHRYENISVSEGR